VLLAVLEQMVSNLEDCASELIIDLNRAEELVFAGPAEGTEASRAIYQYKRELMMLKSAVIPLQQPLKSIIAHQSPGAAGEVIRHFDEVANKLSQVAEQVLYCDDAINSLLQADLAQIDVAQNSDMRRIAAVGAILAGWGLIVGVYQMTQDFETLHKTYAAPLFAATVAVGIAASGVLVVLFRRIRWL